MRDICFFVLIGFKGASAKRCVANGNAVVEGKADVILRFYACCSSVVFSHYNKIQGALEQRGGVLLNSAVVIVLNCTVFILYEPVGNVVSVDNVTVAVKIAPEFEEDFNGRFIGTSYVGVIGFVVCCFYGCVFFLVFTVYKAKVFLYIGHKNDIVLYRYDT